MIIFKFKRFVESVSGTELVGHMGPNYGDQKIPNTLNKGQTEVLFSDLTYEFYTQDDYQSLYITYLKNGGSPLFGFTRENLNIVLSSQIKEDIDNTNSLISSILGNDLPHVIKKSIDGSCSVNINPNKSNTNFIKFVEGFISSQDLKTRSILGEAIQKTKICIDFNNLLDLRLCNITLSNDESYPICLIFYPSHNPIWKEIEKSNTRYN